MTEPTTLRFTEEMKGYVGFDETDYLAGFDRGKRDRTFLMFRLTIEMDDVARFVEDPRHPGTATGWVECDALGGRLDVEKGWFNLFVDTAEAARKLMLYRLFFTDGSGHALTLSGFKDVKDDPGIDAWHDTSTLYTRVLRGHVTADEEDAAEIVATGIITIHVLDFLQQLTTFRTTGPSVAARAEGMAAFGRLFLGKLWDVYGRHVPEGA